MNRAVPAVRYGAVAQGFHWLIAVLFIAAVAIAWYMVDLPLSPYMVKTYNLHKSIGVTILALAVLRLLWRQFNRPPPLPSTMPQWEQRVAHGAHILLYLLLFAQPIIGIVFSWAAGIPVVVFGLFVLPNLMAANESLKEILQWVHIYVGWSFVGLVVLHAAAALRHHFLLKDDVLRRMLPGGLR